MNRTRTPSSLAAAVLIAGMAIAPYAFANGGVVKCIGRDGRVTLTDTACQQGERSVTVVAGAPEPAAEPATASLAAPPSLARTAGMVQTRLPVRSWRPALGRLDPPSRSLARDVATLKAARQAMVLMDSAAGALSNSRHTRVAAY